MREVGEGKSLLPGGGGGVLLGILGGGVPPGSSNPDPISDQEMWFSSLVFTLDLYNPCPFSDLAFRQKLCYHYLIRLGRKYKNYSNLSGIRIFLFLSYSFGIETVKMFIHSVVPSKTQPDSRAKWAKCIPVFRTKRRKNPTRWGGTYPYGLYKGVHPRGST